MKRSPLKRRTPLRSKRSDTLWRDARDAALERDQWDCRAEAHGLDGECEAPLDVHHVRPRSQGGTHDLSNLVCLCRSHHRWVHAHPAVAYRLGLLQRGAA